MSNTDTPTREAQGMEPAVRQKFGFLYHPDPQYDGKGSRVIYILPIGMTREAAEQHLVRAGNLLAGHDLDKVVVMDKETLEEVKELLNKFANYDTYPQDDGVCCITDSPARGPSRAGVIAPGQAGEHGHIETLETERH